MKTKTNTHQQNMVLCQRQKNCKLILLMLTWDCFLMYLLKIHEDLYQWNLCTLGWNLKVGWKKAELHFEKNNKEKTTKPIFFLITDEHCLYGSILHVATLAISREKV